MTIFSTGTRISALFAASFVTLGVQVPFFPVLLAHRGLSETEIAVVVAAPIVLRLSTVSFLGAVADRVGDRRKVLMAYAAAALVGCLTIGVAQGFLALLAATVATTLFGNALLPVIDATATSAARRGEAIYGQMRLWGSLTFVAANLAAGWAIGVQGGGIVFPLLLFGHVLQFTFTPLAPREVRRDEAPSVRPSLWAGMRSLVADRRFLTILIGAALVQASHAMLYGFASLYWTSIGFTGGAVGALWAVSVVGEVILFAKADRALARVGARGLLLIGGVGAVVRWCLFPVLGDSVVAWVALQLVHATSFAATHLGTMHVITRTVEDHRAATSQGLMVSLTGLAMTMTMLASGPLYARFGGAGFLAMAAVAAAGTVVLVAVLGLRRERA